MTLQVRQYIHENGLEALTTNLHIKVTRHKKYPNLVHCHYDMIHSPMNDPVVQQCRTIILDSDKDYSVVAYGYDKFFNYGESLVATIDWDSAKVLEKVDGSLLLVWWYDNQWNVCTTGTPDGGEFAELFWKQFNVQRLKLETDWVAQEQCYMFEYVSPETRIVVPYDKPFVYLHGARNLRTLKEIPYDLVAEYYNWPTVDELPIINLEETLAAVEKLSPREGEGYVVVDKYFNRIKVKSPLYVKLHHLKSSMSARSLLDVARKNEDSEVLSYFPDLEDAVNKYKTEIDSLEEYIIDTFTKVHVLSRLPGEAPGRKTFARYAVKYPYSGALFALLDRKVATAREWICNLPINSLLNLLEKMKELSDATLSISL